MHEIALPMDLSKTLSGYSWRRITIGHSESKTYLLTGAKYNFYLKIQPPSSVVKLFSEKERLEWLQGKLTVPEVVYYDRNDSQEYLLLTEVKGINASDKCFETMVPKLMKQLAYGLRTVHEISIGDCPFNERLEHKIKEAKSRVERNLVNEEDFDQSRKGKRAGELFNELLSNKPLGEDLVFTHGDFCLPNIVINEGQVSGFIDVGRSGVADRYQDIALAIRSTAYNFGYQHVNRFLEEYDIKQLDESKVHFYQLLDEFF
jgi:aminoglycoside phosphotransferase